ncbi:MAG: hypothetical protein PVF83_12485 [Anaerolineales bacterium]|jgi:hypothetical protein
MKTVNSMAELYQWVIEDSEAAGKWIGESYLKILPLVLRGLYGDTRGEEIFQEVRTTIKGPRELREELHRLHIIVKTNGMQKNATYN